MKKFTGCIHTLNSAQCRTVTGFTLSPMPMMTDFLLVSNSVVLKDATNCALPGIIEEVTALPFLILQRGHTL